MKKGIFLAAALAWTAAGAEESVEISLDDPSGQSVEIEPSAPPASVDLAASDLAASTATRVFFSPEDDCDNIVIGALYRARRSIDAAVFLVSHPGIADALVHAHMSGVKVRVILDGEQAKFKVALDEVLERAGVPLLRTRGPGSMHNKFAVIDGRMVLTGSYNWTVGGASVNDENLIVLHGPVEAYRRKFDEIWSRR